jgi:hypothetical protein
VARPKPMVDCPLQSFGLFKAGDAKLLPPHPPLMQLACPSESFEIVGSTLLVQYSPHALGRDTVLQGISDNSLRSRWNARSLLS